MGRTYHDDTYERLRQQRRRLEIAVEAFEGKRALWKTYEMLGIRNDYTHDLELRVKKRRKMLEHRIDF